ncbi:tetratricopeptide repeat protein [Omnitrophica bacterium]|nr:tetratricopeptide repeat protein [Candidatus Omnitrophota bacterium]
MQKQDRIKAQTISLSVIVIIILGLAVYANSSNGKFVWDDTHLIKENIYIRNWSNISDIFTKHTRGVAQGKSCFYRPLQILTFMVDYSLWRFNVRGYHLTNLILHILTALAVFWLINVLYKDAILSLFTGLLFVAHPIHTEAISYISGRADPLASVFLLLSLIFYIKHAHSNSVGAYIFMSLSYLLALLSRENSLILPLLLLLYHSAFRVKVKAKGFLSILSITFIYILFRFTVLRQLLTHVDCPNTLFQRLPGFFVAVTNYIRLLLVPINLHMEYGNKLFSLTYPAAIAGILILSFLLFYAFSSKRRDSNNLFFFSISWFFIALLPASNLYPINAYMAEHWLYLPSIGFFLILARGLLSFLPRVIPVRVIPAKAGIHTQDRNNSIAISMLVVLLIFYSYLTIRQNSYWSEPVALYERTLKYAPESSSSYNNLGIIYGDKKDFEKAIELFKKAIEADPDNTGAYNNLGKVYRSRDRNEEAIELYKKAIDLQPESVTAHYNLGNAYRDAGRHREAVDSYKNAIAISPYYVKAHYNLGNIYHTLGRDKEAIASYKKAIAIDPHFVYAYGNLGSAYNAIGKFEEAIAAYKKAVEIDPNDAYAYNNLAAIFFQQEEYRLAIQYCDKARSLGIRNPTLLEVLQPHREK